ncbi:ferrochelatase [Dongia deserti]|uniref:ferrochelatase n=1 Tax=Dongia deserti TaxID=2268030 RepID=UPI000E64E0C2|nr:ferrochelatase [Dongia deserti]
MTRTAIVLFNLGGPDSLEAVKPFLTNLFNDPAIIRLPTLLRSMIAALIARRRTPVAREIYARMGNRSPILPNTEAQARALEQALGGEVKTFIAMRYWHPMTVETVAAVKAYAPDEVILLPLYPQFSTTTTASSYKLWREEAARQSLTVPQRLVCCYPTDPGFIEAACDLVRQSITTAAREAPGINPLVVFSAHGLPKKVVDDGDPYVSQVEASAAAIVAKLGLQDGAWIISYQSRVGPLAWVQPATDQVILQASKDKRALVVFPIAFVSEHSETLVELDIEYRHLADANGAAAYVRVPTVDTHSAFIGGLAALVKGALARDAAVQDGSGQQHCANWRRCACKAASA